MVARDAVRFGEHSELLPMFEVSQAHAVATATWWSSNTRGEKLKMDDRILFCVA
jgi:hypothetical protein